VGACTLVVVDMVRKNAMGVVLQITRLQIASSRRGTGNTQVSGAENNPVSQGGRSPTNAISRSNRGGKRPQAGGRVFSMRGEEAEDPTVAVLGTLLIKHLYVHVLFDSGATYSLVNPAFAKKLASKPSEMDVQLYVTTLLGSIYCTDLVFKNCTVQLEGRVLPVDLVHLNKVMIKNKYPFKFWRKRRRNPEIERFRVLRCYRNITRSQKQFGN